MVLLASLMAGVFGPRPAFAAMPNQDGLIVFGSQHAGEYEIWKMNPDGSNKHNLTRKDGAKISGTRERRALVGLVISSSITDAWAERTHAYARAAGL